MKAATFTFRPPLLDNKNLIIGQERLEKAQINGKKIQEKIEIVQAALLDSRNGNDGKSKLAELKEFYLDTDEFLEALNLYIVVSDLWIQLTEKQQTIIHLFICERKRIIDIALELNISDPAVIKHLTLIKRKSKKLKINQFI